jgi:Uma2 family endonuclease
MALLPDAPFLTMAPDWICEVLSPGSARFDRKKKMPLYGQEGVRNAWLVDPEERTLEIYRLIDARWSPLATHSDDERVRAEPFDAIELNLSILWADVEPPANQKRPQGGHLTSPRAAGEGAAKPRGQGRGAVDPKCPQG